jgi:hypothetical protein
MLKNAESPTTPNPVGAEVPVNKGTNKVQDAFEKLRELLKHLDINPAEMRVDWNTPGQQVPVIIGRLSLLDVLKLNRALKGGLPRRRFVNLNEERPHRPLIEETVFGEGPGQLIVVPDRVNRERLVSLRTAQPSRARQSLPPALEPVDMNRVVQ